MRRSFARLALAGALLGACACAQLAAIEEPRDRVDAGVAETGGPETGLADTAGMDALAEAAVDAPSPTDGCIAGGPEVCTDGVDNDCNGAVDCADPACAAGGYACVPAIPGGWTFGALSAGALSCAAGTTSQAYVAATGAPATCGCSCVVGQPPQCGGATVSVQTGSDSACNAGAQPYSTSACTVLGAVPAYVAGGPVQASGGTCSAQSTSSVPPVAVTDWSSCLSDGPFGAGCSSPGEVCAWAGGASRCVTAPGVQSCPAAYAASSHALGSGYADTRACSPACGGCGSTPTAICAATVTFYSGSGCNGGAIPVTLDGTCTSTVEAALSYRYAASASNVSCGTPTVPAPVGAVTLNGTTTACCAP